MDSELKPCPFCGGKAVFHTESNSATHHCVGFAFKIECECGMELPGTYHVEFSLKESGEINVFNDERPEAVEKWNRRP